MKAELFFIESLSALHIKNIRSGAHFFPQHPHRFLQLVDQFIDATFRIGQIAEYPNISGAGLRAGLSAGHISFAFGKPRLKAEITFINGAFGLVEISRVIGAGHHAGFTADTFLVIHHDDTVDLSLISCLCRACPHTGGIVALVT